MSSGKFGHVTTAFNDVTGALISTAASKTDKKKYAEGWTLAFGTEAEKAAIRQQRIEEEQMATKTVFTFTIPFFEIILENIKVKYRILPGGHAGMDESSRTYPRFEVEEALYDGRDVRAFLTQKQLDALCIDVYFKTVAQVPDKPKPTPKKTKGGKNGNL